MIVDDAIRSTPHHAWDWRHVVQALPRARRFVLSDDASRRLGRIVAATEDQILRNHQFALAPYPQTYVELSLAEYLSAMGQGRAQPTSPDRRLGYLVDGDDVRVFVAGADYDRAYVSALGYRRWPPGSPAPRGETTTESFARGLAESARWTLDSEESLEWCDLALFLGSSVHALPDEETRRSILDSWQMIPVLQGTPAQTSLLHRAPASRWDDLEKFFSCFYGELRTLWAILLLLNAPQHYRCTPQPPRRAIRRGRSVVYAAHSVVDLELGRTRDYRRLWSHLTDRASPRRHEVRGHFRHHGGREEGCAHDWPVARESASAPTWACRLCGRSRTWIAHHERGDASRGFVTKEYAVAAGNDA